MLKNGALITALGAKVWRQVQLSRLTYFLTDLFLSDGERAPVVVVDLMASVCCGSTAQKAGTVSKKGEIVDRQPVTLHSRIKSSGYSRVAPRSSFRTCETVNVSS